MFERLKIHEPRLRLILALAGGLCLGMAFPHPGVAGFAWVAPAIIIGSALGVPDGWQRFRYGYFAGLAHYLYSLHWLLHIPYRWAGIPLAPALGWIALAMFLSLFMGVWVWLATGAGLERTQHSFENVNFRATRLTSWLAVSWARRLAWACFGAASWVGMEMFITRVFGGFPWNLLGASQYQLTPLLQIAEFTGVCGIAFLAVWFSLSLVLVWLVVQFERQRRASWFAELIVPSVVVALVFNWGFREIPAIQDSPARTIKVALIQPSIPQNLIWDPANDDARFQQLLRMSEQALTNHPDLLIWPEAAVPKLLRYDRDVFQAVTNLAASHKVWMIIGADDAEPKRATPDPNDAEYYNSSFLISPEGRLLQRYRKRSLVIFGEYIPLVRWMPFLSWFTPIQGGFTAGDAPVRFPLEGLDVQTSVLICFEDIFPQLGRSAADLETDFLVNITNDGWFGRSAAPWQHATSAIVRTVENRLPLIRCTNNGLTCWIDEYGRLREIQRDAQGTIYGESMGVYTIPLPRPRTSPTFFNAYGDVFGWSCSGLALLVLAGTEWMRRREIKARGAMPVALAN